MSIFLNIVLGEQRLFRPWRSFIKRQASATSSDNEWQRAVQRVTTMTTSGTTSDKKWQRVVQGVTASGTTSDNEWQRVTTSENDWYYEWQGMTTSDHGEN